MEIIDGMSNLTEITKNEKIIIWENDRLACQCRIKKGMVKKISESF